jgi:putative ABC transport system permease protein
MNSRLPIPLWLALRGLRQHAAASLCAAALIALATGGALSALALRQASARAFAASAGPFDAVLGARSSPLQLVLAAIFHLEAAPGLVPETELDRLSANPAVRHVVPLAFGDNFQGWRLVGTSESLFTPDLWLGQPSPPRIAPGGRIFTPAAFEIVVGSQAAAVLRLRIGDRLKPTHGLDYAAETAGENEHHQEFTVVGLLTPTGTPLDRVLWAPVQTIQELEGHDPVAAHELSVILIRLDPAAPASGFMLAQGYNASGGAYTFAWPVAAHVAALFERFAWADRLMGVAAAFAALLSGLCVGVALQASLAQRRRDWAILRAIGAHARALGAAIVCEAALIGAVGALGALAVCVTLGALVSWQVRLRTGVILAPAPDAGLLLGGAIAVPATCILASLWSAREAIRSPVAEHLKPRS